MCSFPTRPEDVLDPGDRAAGVTAAGGGASGWCSAEAQSLYSFGYTQISPVLSVVVVVFGEKTFKTDFTTKNK